MSTEVTIIDIDSFKEGIANVRDDANSANWYVSLCLGGDSFVAA